MQAALRHPLDQLAQAQLAAQVPENAQEDDLQSKCRSANKPAMLFNLLIRSASSIDKLWRFNLHQSRAPQEFAGLLVALALKLAIGR